jgi:hypothetical protein
MSNNFRIFGYLCGLILIIFIILILRKQVTEHLLQDDPMLYTLKEVLTPVHPMIKNLKLYKADKSYTINKDKIFLCLYDQDGNYYPLNMLIYVLLHEVAHKINEKDIGHTEAFYNVFDDLLEKATNIGVYNPDIPIIKNYCNS